MKKIKLNSWGKFTNIDASQYNWKDIQELKSIITSNKSFIPSGNYRSYGDSAFSDNIINCKTNNNVILFDKSNGFLKAEAGITLSEILTIVIQHGWFLGVTPGTKYSTLGGAIASDVHGKNHHINGCFSEYISDIDLMLPSGSIVNLTKEDELFKATCGGMGLTGVIVSANIRLVKIMSTTINQTTIKTDSLLETFNVFEEFVNETYSVAWFDGFSKGKNFGRSIVQIGNFSTDGNLEFKDQSIKFLPFKLFSFFFNKYFIRIFNSLFYTLTSSKKVKSKVHFTKFFYPLDKFYDWNKIYGKNGFFQAQFLVKENNFKDIMNKIAKFFKDEKNFSTFIIIKKFDEKGKYLNFYGQGFSISMDIPINSKFEKTKNFLNSIFQEYDIKINFSKDSIANKDVIKNKEEYSEFVKELNFINPERKFNSIFSKRLEM